jgi:hypothetical protein
MFLEVLPVIGIFFMVTGSLLNSLKKRVCFLFWAVSNLIFLVRSIWIQDMIYFIVFAIMLYTSIFALIFWGKEN